MCQVTFLLVLGSHVPPAEVLLDNQHISFIPWKTQGDGTRSGFAAADDRTKPASSLAQDFPITNFLGGSSSGEVESLNQEPDKAPTGGLRIADLSHGVAEPGPSVPSWSF